jgi:membrane protease YdiL (CAAX protease family)
MLKFLELKSVVGINSVSQILIILLLIVFTYIYQLKQYRKTGKAFGHYPFRLSIFLSPLYEEIIFRGIVLVYLIEIFKHQYFFAIFITSILFGLWHLKNYKWLTKKELYQQVLYTGFVFNPIICFITLYTGTIWIGVIVHYVHNIVVDYLNNFIKKA